VTTAPNGPRGDGILDPRRSGQFFNLGSEAACLCRKRAEHAAKLMSSLAQARRLAIAKLPAGLETYLLRWRLLADIFENWGAWISTFSHNGKANDEF
jgi:hypothetical protein